jgi:subtilisin-like proprotein convertase family protein
MPYTSNTNGSTTNRFANRRNSDQPRPRSPQQIVKTWSFDSVGNRKYALQIKKASNGNPCLKIVEGVPRDDGTFRRFELTIWSEDFPRLFQTLDEVRTYMKDNNVKTPDGHKYDPNRKFPRRSAGKAASFRANPRASATATSSR